MIGITYEQVSSQNTIEGCGKDILKLYEFLTEKRGFQASNIIILTDAVACHNLPGTTVRDPTRSNILYFLRWLVEGDHPSKRKPNDSLFLSYSGHGEQTDEVPDSFGNFFEKDMKDENILPVDCETERPIRDNVLYDIVKTIPARVMLTVLFDSCHSGSAMDLTVEYEIDRRCGQMRGIVQPRHEINDAHVGNVVFFGACRDDETVPDSGPLTKAFIEAMRSEKEGGGCNPLTYEKVFKHIDAKLTSGGLMMSPQFSSLKPLRPHQLIIL